MRRLEEAARRLETAVGRLERAAARAGGNVAETQQLVAALADAEAENAALEETTSRVASRLDAAIVRLTAVLEI